MSVANDYAVDKDNYSKYENVKSILKYGEKKKSRVDLSVVIPTYKKPKKLKDALESVMEQERYGLSIEIIVVDNDWFELSGTETEKVIKNYSITQIAYYQNEANIGMYGNWNRCIELASAEWISMLHDDDSLSKGYFLNAIRMLRTAHKNPKLVFIRANSLVTRNGNIEGGNGMGSKIRQSFKSKLMIFDSRDYDILGPDKIGILGAPSCGSLMKKAVYMKYGGFDDSHFPSADVYFPERLVTRHGLKVALTVGACGYARFDDNTSIKESVVLGWANEYMVYARYYQKRSKTAAWLFKHFENEMAIQIKRYYESIILKSDYIANKENAYNKLNAIMNSRYKSIKDKIYNRYWWKIYYRWKQVVAILTT